MHILLKIDTIIQIGCTWTIHTRTDGYQPAHAQPCKLGTDIHICVRNDAQQCGYSFAYRHVASEPYTQTWPSASSDSDTYTSIGGYLGECGIGPHIVIHIYVCVCTCKFACTLTHTCRHEWMHTHRYILSCTHPYICVYALVCAYIYVHPYIHVRTHARLHL